MPGGQRVQLRDSGASENCPGGHSWQLGASGASEYVPLGQMEHDCSGEGGQLLLRPPKSCAWRTALAALPLLLLPAACEEGGGGVGRK